MGNHEFFEHFPEEITVDIERYATNEVLSRSRYLFTSREGRRQFAFCTHCKQEHLTDGLRHGELAECPHCMSEARVRASGRGRSKLLDEAYLLWYEKSQVNPQAIIARGFYLARDYRGDYRGTETAIRPIALYLFEPGVGGRMANRYYWRDNAKWQFPVNVRSEAVHSMKNKSCYWAKHTLRDAVKGTPFQYSTWEKYDHQDMVKFMDLAARYPCIEFLTKAGMSPIGSAKLHGQATYGAINWNGKSFEKVLRLTKPEAKEWLKLPYKSGLLSLYAFQKFKKLGLNFSFDTAHQVCQLAEKSRLSELLACADMAPIPVLVKYFLKQFNRKGANRVYYDVSRVFGDWKDYIKECRELGMDITRAAVLFPNDLHEAHQRTSAKIKYKRDEALNAQIVKRAKKLAKQYGLQHSGLLIRPAATNKELFEEGKALSHCVGGYAQRYADGKTDILVIRKVEAPRKPFFTMEVQDGKVVQCRGMKNCSMTPEVKAFVDRFIAEKLERKQVRIKTRQEVAV